MPDADALVTDHLPLAEYMGSRWHARIPVDDAQQEAVIGLLKAARKFSPDRGVEFDAFARAVIRNHLNRAVFDYSPLPTHPEPAPERSLEEECEALRAAMAKLMPDVRMALQMRYGESEATFEEIGKALDCSHPTARAMVAAGLAQLKSMMEG